MAELLTDQEKFEHRSATNRRYRNKCHQEGRCTRCATSLFEEEKGYKTCINCRDSVGKGFSEYGTINSKFTI